MAGTTPVAIVGMAVLLPDAPDLETYWTNIVEGHDAITDVPAHRWDPEFYDPGASADRVDRVYCRRGGFVDAYAEVAPNRFGIMPASVPGTEPDQLLALRVAAAAVADAGGHDRVRAAGRVGVVLGRGGYAAPATVRLEQRVRTANQLVQSLREMLPDLPADTLDRVRASFTDQLGPAEPESAIGLVSNLAASRIANRMDLHGPAYTIDAACASSLLAVDHGVADLAAGRCDAVLAGGVHHCHDITLWSVFTQLRALSRRQQVRPFDQRADGILLGEGTGIVVLKRLDDALRDDDRIYAVIRGTGTSSDGRSSSLFNPEPAGQARAVRRAWAAAGLDPTEPRSIGLLEAHGTGTPTGDLAEITTLAEVFGPPRDGDQAVIGSVKSMIGHTMLAAGVAGLVKAALAVHRAVLPPTLHCEEPRAELAGTRFRPVPVAQPWECPAGPRRAGVNAFGFGGINAHVVIEEPPQRPRSVSRRPVMVAEPEKILRFAVGDAATLTELLGADDAAVRARGVVDDVAATGPCRLGIVAPSPKRLALARRVVAAGKPWRGRNDVWFTPRPLLFGADPGRIAFVFPGLEAEFAPQVDDVAARLGEAATSAEVTNVVRQGMAVIDVGRLLDRALRRMKIRPDAVAGHSIGEWTAMTTAGVFAADEIDDFVATFDPDAERVPGLVFAAVGAGADAVSRVLPDYPDVVLSHDNAPSQSIVCGPQAAVEALVATLRRRGVLCQTLPFRSGFHTPMLEPYLEPIRAGSQRFTLRPPSVPVWSATIAAPFPDDPHEVRALYFRHLVEPVRFRPMIEAMYAAGLRVFVQVGPGQLASVIDDVLHGRDHLAVPANSAHRGGLAQLRRVATALWVEGAAPDTAFLDGRDRMMRLDLGGALVSLGAGARNLLPATAPAPVPAPAPGGDALSVLAQRVPVAAELAAMLRETADAAATVLHARELAGPQLAGPQLAGPQLAGPQRSVIRVSLDTMPYIRDHCMFRQPDWWPDEADRRPVLPGATVLAHMMTIAENTRPGQHATAVERIRFNRWITGEPAVDITVTAIPAADGFVDVSFEGFTRAAVQLAPAYPRAPHPWPRPEPHTERAPAITAAEMYSERWMFHGPRYHGVRRLVAISDTGFRARLETPEVPGGLIDAVAQVFGYWILAMLPTRNIVFPVGISRIGYYGPHPPVGAALDCVLRVREVTDEQVVADAQLLLDGRVWAQVDGLVERRFDSFPTGRGVELFADRNTLSAPQPGGWVLYFDRLKDLASRELMMPAYFNADERADYDRHPPRTRRAWLSGRVAVKDAMRRLMWQTDPAPVFPNEIRVFNLSDGRPSATGLHGRVVPSVDVSLAHSGEAGVAVVGSGVGIDIEEIRDRPPSTEQVALSDTELGLLAALVDETGDSRDVWFTRFWAAKEAVSKAIGTGLLARPQRFVVTAATPSEAVVEVPELARVFRVEHTRVDNPPDLPARRYVVAWTRGASNTTWGLDKEVAQ
jgi:acyl transferase domain-containing protein/phosphopantetheinyl transferase